jgi:hypothetical protein
MIDKHIAEQRININVPLGDVAREDYPPIEEWKEGDLKELAMVIDNVTLKLIFR